MSTVFKEYFPVVPIQITAGCDGLAASTTVGRSSAVVDNTFNLYQDALIGGTFITSIAGIGGTKSISVYTYSEVDTTPHYTDGVTGSSAGFTRTDPPNLILLGIANINTSGTPYYFGQWSVASAFGGTLPAKWGLAIFNDTGASLSGLSGNDNYNTLWYRPVQTQGV